MSLERLPWYLTFILLSPLQLALFQSHPKEPLSAVSSSRCSSLGAPLDDSVATTKSGSPQTHNNRFGEERRLANTKAGTSGKEPYSADIMSKRRRQSSVSKGRRECRGTPSSIRTLNTAGHVAAQMPSSSNTRLKSKRKLQTYPQSQGQELEMKAMVSDILMKTEKEHLKRMKEKYNFNFTSEEPEKKGRWDWQKKS